MRRQQFICKKCSFLAANSSISAASALRSRSASPSSGNKSGGHQLLTSSYSFMLRLLCLSRSFAGERIPSQEGSNKNEAIKVSSFTVMTPPDRQPRTSSPAPCTPLEDHIVQAGLRVNDRVTPVPLQHIVVHQSVT